MGEPACSNSPGSATREVSTPSVGLIKVASFFCWVGAATRASMEETAPGRHRSPGPRTGARRARGLLLRRASPPGCCAGSSRRHGPWSSRVAIEQARMRSRSSCAPAMSASVARICAPSPAMSSLRPPRCAGGGSASACARSAFAWRIRISMSVVSRARGGAGLSRRRLHGAALRRAVRPPSPRCARRWPRRDPYDDVGAGRAWFLQCRRCRDGKGQEGEGAFHGRSFGLKTC